MRPALPVISYCSLSETQKTVLSILNLSICTGTTACDTLEATFVAFTICGSQQHHTRMHARAFGAVAAVLCTYPMAIHTAQLTGTLSHNQHTTSPMPHWEMKDRTRTRKTLWCTPNTLSAQHENARMTMSPKGGHSKPRSLFAHAPGVCTYKAIPQIIKAISRTDLSRNNLFTF